MFSNNFYNKRLKKISRLNRKNQTTGESILWSKLRQKQVLGLRFLRQRPIDKYIVDFLQPDTKLIIEVDGLSHDELTYDYDLRREEKLRSLGFSVLRFAEYDVRTRVYEVMESVYYKLAELL